MNLNNFENVTHSAQGETVFWGGIFCLEYPSTRSEKGYVHFANYRFSFHKLQIPISQTTDSHFANYRFPFRKLQIYHFHFANYRFSFRKLQISISQTTDLSFPFRKLQISISQTTDFHFANYRFPFRFVPFRFANCFIGSYNGLHWTEKLNAVAI